VQYLLIYGLFCLLQSSFANQVFRPTSTSEIDSGRKDQFVFVPGSQILWVNERALKRDFPFLRILDSSAIEKWILKEFSYISLSQLKLNKIRNSEIHVDPEKNKSGFRPTFPNYHTTIDYLRAALFELPDDTVIDLKGVGYLERSSRVYKLNRAFALESQLRDFQNADGDQAAIDEIRSRVQSNGLLGVKSGIAEVVNQSIVQSHFNGDASELGFQTIENYFLLLYPFHILKPGGKLDPAVLLGRQAHFGREHHLKIPDQIYADPSGGKQGDYYNAAVDFEVADLVDRSFQADILAMSYQISNGSARGTQEAIDSLLSRYANLAHRADLPSEVLQEKANFRHLLQALNMKQVKSLASRLFHKKRSVKLAWQIDELRKYFLDELRKTTPVDDNLCVAIKETTLLAIEGKHNWNPLVGTSMARCFSLVAADYAQQLFNHNPQLWVDEIALLRTKTNEWLVEDLSDHTGKSNFRIRSLLEVLLSPFACDWSSEREKLTQVHSKGFTYSLLRYLLEETNKIFFPSLESLPITQTEIKHFFSEAHSRFLGAAKQKWSLLSTISWWPSSLASLECEGKL